MWDSPPVTLPSASTHWPPMGIHWPRSTAAEMSAKRLGYRSFIHSYWAACEQPNRNSGSSSMSRRTLEKVREHLRTVSRMGHSHAESMWAWPMAETWWADGTAGLASTGASTARAAAAVPTMSSGSSASRLAPSAMTMSFWRGSFCGSSFCHPSRQS